LSHFPFITIETDQNVIFRPMSQWRSIYPHFSSMQRVSLPSICSLEPVPPHSRESVSSRIMRCFPSRLASSLCGIRSPRLVSLLHARATAPSFLFERIAAEINSLLAVCHRHFKPASSNKKFRIQPLRRNSWSNWKASSHFLASAYNVKKTRWW
jgi:hypothetical protein